MSERLSLSPRLVGRYHLETCLASGTETETWSGQSLCNSPANPENKVILKLLHLGQMADWKQLELFQREARTLRHLNHPRIPRLLDDFSFETAQGLTYALVTEQIPGQTLVERLQGNWLPTEGDCIELAGQVLEILYYLHAFQPPVVHRDIKPSNLMLDQDNRLFLIDFGAVQELLWLEGCGGSTTIGTLGYMAPEQLLGKALPVSDLYGLGATLVHLLTGRNPLSLSRRGDKLQYRGFTDCSVPFLDWIDSLLCSTASQRIASAEAAMRQLDAISGRRLRARYWTRPKPMPAQPELCEVRPASAPELPDKLLESRFQIVEVLGKGSRTRVYKGLRLADNKPVVIKVLNLRKLAHWKELELFRREADVLQNLNYRGIPRFLEYVEDNTGAQLQLLLVTEAVPGKSLQQLLLDGWRPTQSEVWDLARQLLEILIYLQNRPQPILHRDIKPSNLLQDDQQRLYLIDFGAVQNRFRAQGNGGSTVIGTVGYMAPEQYGGKAGLNTDLYGLGATLIHLLSGRHPAQMEYDELRPRFEAHLTSPRAIHLWLNQLLATRPEDRFSDAQTALQAFQSLPIKMGDAANLLPPGERQIHAPALAVCREQLAQTDLMPDTDQPVCRIPISQELAVLGYQKRSDWMLSWLLAVPVFFFTMACLLLPIGGLVFVILLIPLSISLHALQYPIGELMDSCFYPLSLAQAPVEIVFTRTGLCLRQRCDLAQPKPGHNQPGTRRRKLSCHEPLFPKGWIRAKTEEGHYHAKYYLWSELQAISLRKVWWLWGPQNSFYRLKVRSRSTLTKVCMALDHDDAACLKSCLDTLLQQEKQQANKPAA